MGFTIYFVASVQHNSMLRKLGAHRVYDRTDNDLLNEVIASVKSDNRSLRLGVDCISKGSTLTNSASILSAFSSEQNKCRLATSLPWPEATEIFINVETGKLAAFQIFSEKSEIGEPLFTELLPYLLKE